MQRQPSAASDWQARGSWSTSAAYGVLVAESLRSQLALRTTLVDLPGTVARGRQFLAALGLDARCEFSGQSFFDPLPPGGDVYILNQVLHDWGTRKRVRSCSAARRRSMIAAGSL